MINTFLHLSHLFGGLLKLSKIVYITLYDIEVDSPLRSCLKYELQALSTTLCALRVLPPADRVTSTKSSFSRRLLNALVSEAWAFDIITDVLMYNCV